MIKQARILKRISRPNFCGAAGVTEFYLIDDPQIQMIPCADFRYPVQIGGVIEFAYVAAGNGYRWLPQ